MAIERVKTRVAGRVGKPAAIDACLFIKNACRRLNPVDLFGRLGPKGLRIGAPLRIDFSVAAGHRAPPLSSSKRFATLGARTQSHANATIGQGGRKLEQ